ncbi:MAG: hypothetical protein Q8M74_06520 [Chloroflexota bacterium]|nr:hypothetical protein [Chloroflexota bacterium]
MTLGKGRQRTHPAVGDEDSRFDGDQAVGERNRSIPPTRQPGQDEPGDRRQLDQKHAGVHDGLPA